MSFSPIRLRALLNVSVTALMFLGGIPGVSLSAATKAPEEHPPTVSYDARTMDADIKTHVMRLTDVTITYGKMTVRADRAFATAGDFKNSRWTFDGNVRINAEPRGNLRSDEAVVEFEDNQLKRATATGNPAQFDQKREDSNAITRGHANEIIYEVGAGTVRLSNDAWVSDGKDDITGPVIVYSLRDEHVEAMSSTSATTGTPARIHVTLSPNESPKSDTKGDGASKTKTPAADPNAPATPQGSTAPATSPASGSTPTAPAASSPPSGSSVPAPQSSPH
jgi:lipopolysaccharide transport protein LptA